MTLELMIARIGQSFLILGFPWLQTWNPDMDWKYGTLAWQKETPVSPNISAKRPTATLINLISKTTCKGLGLDISLASPICPQQQPTMGPVSPFSITTDVKTSFTSVMDIGPSRQSVQRQEMPMEEPLATAVPSKTPNDPSFDMPDAHIRTIEEQEAQDTWAALIINEDEELQFWLNMLETLEETDSFLQVRDVDMFKDCKGNTPTLARSTTDDP